MKSVASYIIREILEEIDPQFWFGLAGANIEVLLAEAIQAGANVTIAKHEFSAGCMADAASKLTGKPACILTTSGAGALNIIPALAESYATQTPVLAIIGDPPLITQGTGAFQEASGLGGTFDILELFKPISKYCHRLRSQKEWKRTWQEALYSLKNNRGPVVLIIPRDIQTDEWLQTPSEASENQSLLPLENSELDFNKWSKTLEEHSKNAFIILGDEVVRQKCGKFSLEIIDKFKIPFALTIGAKEIASSEHPLFAGIIGTLGHKQVSENIKNANLIWVIGSQLPQMDRYGFSLDKKEVIAVTWNTQPSWISLEQKMNSVVTKNLSELLSGFCAHISLENNNALKNTSANPVGRIPENTPEKNSDLIDLKTIASAFSPLTSNRPLTIITDAGNACAAVARDLKFSEHSQFLIALGMGGMGYSFGAAIGAATTTPHPVIAFAGDGAFFMHGMEIHTAIEKNLPILFVILDNHAHAMCVTRDKIYLHLENSPSLFKQSSIANGLNALFPSLLVKYAKTHQDIYDCTEELRQNNGPAALVVELNPHDFPPFLPFQGEKKLC